MNNRRKLSEFLAEVSEWRWDQFVRAELDNNFTTSESIVFALIRACAMENLAAIKTALGRLDGKLATPVRVVMPKVIFQYPNATEALSTIVVEQETQPGESIGGEMILAEDMNELEYTPALPTKGFRDTMDKMVDQPRELPKTLIEAQEQVEKHVRSEGRAPILLPKVKSVVVAHILKMAQERDMDAINEVFDQLDGKLVETIRVVGEDMYIMQFSTVAPIGAVKNAEGIYEIEATRSQEIWRQKLDNNPTAFIES